MKREGQLLRNDCQRFEVGDYELTSGSLIEIQINRTWLLGVIEHWRDGYYWFSKFEGIAVILRNGIQARLPERF